VQLTRIIIKDEREQITCSAVLEGEYGLSGCSIGVPARVGRNGIMKIEEWNLDAWEREKMNNAGEFVKDLCTRAVS
jgi:malate dehydrogenase